MTSSVLTCPNPDCKQALATSTLPGRFRCPSCGWILQIRFTESGVVLQQATAGDSAPQLPVAPVADIPAAVPPAPPAAGPQPTPAGLAQSLLGPVPAPAGSNTLLYVMLAILAVVMLAGIAWVLSVILSHPGTSKAAAPPAPGPAALARCAHVGCLSPGVLSS
jgi:hypothetical protein